ncbi:MAG: glycosyltransferase [Myxococcales bacterium]|nr:glycosyltransferase [Myxococcales bacterium]
MQLIAKPLKSCLSVVIPFYNEEDNIDASLNAALAYLRARFADFEIIAVDDASTDQTPVKARSWQAYDRRVKIVTMPRNTRYAGALKAGLAAATKEYVFYTDGDCPIDYEDIDRALALTDRCDVVIGYRLNRDREALRRKLFTWGYRLILRLLLKMKFRDVNFSFKLFRRRDLRKLELQSTGSFIDAEILYRLQRMGCRIREIPVQYHSRRGGRSTLASLAIIRRVLREMAVFWRQNRPRRTSPLTEGRAALG